MPSTIPIKKFDGCRLIWCAHTNQKRGIALLITDDRTKCSHPRGTGALESACLKFGGEAISIFNSLIYLIPM
jgi:hypothetical protein